MWRKPEIEKLEVHALLHYTSDDIVGQCTCTSVKMTLHCPAVCLRPPRGVTREEVANIGSCLHLSANRRKLCISDVSGHFCPTSLHLLTLSWVEVVVVMGEHLDFYLHHKTSHA